LIGICGLFVVIATYWGDPRDIFFEPDYSCIRCIDSRYVVTKNTCVGAQKLICESIDLKEKEGEALSLEEFENLGTCECLTNVYVKTGETITWNKISECYCSKNNPLKETFIVKNSLYVLIAFLIFCAAYCMAILIVLLTIFYLYKIKSIFWDKDVLIKIVLILLIVLLITVIIKIQFPSQHMPWSF
jgi:hypothetical protein